MVGRPVIALQARLAIRNLESMKAVFAVLVVLVVVALGIGFVGARYLANFNGMLTNPRCQHDCWESGKRVR